MAVEYERARDNKLNIEFIQTEGCNPHFHQQIELLAVVEGRIDVTVNESSFSLESGDICVSDSFDIHGYVRIGAALGYVVIVPERFLSQYRTASKDKMLVSNRIRDPAVFRRVLALMKMLGSCLLGEDARRLTSSERDLLSGALCTAIMGYVSVALTYAPRKSGLERLDLMRDVLGYLTEHFDEDVTLPALASRYGYTPNHFSYLFNSFVRCGLKEYLGDIRVVHAAELLKEGSSVTDAAMASGFTSMRTFYRQFERQFGTAPNHWTKRNGLSAEPLSSQNGTERPE